MRLKLHVPKLKKPHFPQTNSYSQHNLTKGFSRKKVIAPISPEADIRAAAAAHKPVSSTSSSKKNTAPPADSAKHLISGSAAKMDAHIKVGLLTSNLDDKIRRRRKSMAFIAKVLLWGVILYVLVLSKAPAILTIFSR